MPKLIPPSQILELYQIKGMSAKEIAERFGVTRQAISYRLKAAGVPRRSGRPEVKYPDRKLIEQLYVGERLSIPAVAERLNETRDRIKAAMRKYSIEPRPRGGQPKFPQLRELKVGESIELPRRPNKPHIAFYDMAKKAGIR